MEKIAIILFMIIIAYYLLIMDYTWITGNIQMRRDHMDWAPVVGLGFIVFLLLCLAIDRSLFPMIRDQVIHYF